LVCPVRGKYTFSGLLTVTSRPATSRTILRVAMPQGYDTGAAERGCGAGGRGRLRELRGRVLELLSGVAGCG
jgi:hypothetical protein